MTNNTQLPAEVENAIIKESYVKYNLVRQGGEREAYREGAIEYATKLNAAQQEIESLTNQLKKQNEVQVENITLLKAEHIQLEKANSTLYCEVNEACTLLQKFISQHEAGLLPDRLLYNEIKTFLDGK